ncbi:MAG: hypothetical protein IJ446_07545 [Oscillospiraceae bacterium]|nr:hypothetical protein [Oscillospiraceae bacterium]
MKVKTDTPFKTASEVYIYRNGIQILPVFYISRPGYGNGIAEITAFDSCRKLERDFDTSDYFSEDREYSFMETASAIGGQCGFEGTVFPDLNRDNIPYRFLKGHTCREILQLMSECGCGVWYCNNNNQLVFIKLFQVTDSYTLTEEKCSDFRKGSFKGPVVGVRAENTLEDKIYMTADASFDAMINVSGKLINEEVAAKITSDISGKEYRAFSCRQVITDSVPDSFSGFIYNDILYRAVSIITYITVYGCCSTVSAAVICEDENDYKGSLSYMLRRRITEEKKYGCTIISGEGLKMVYCDDEKGE